MVYPTTSVRCVFALLCKMLVVFVTLACMLGRVCIVYWAGTFLYDGRGPISELGRTRYDNWVGPVMYDGRAR